MDDPYAAIADLYDLEMQDFADDLLFYENLARRCEGPILELGVGTGRVAIPLARAGFEVWGIDASEAMLTRARSHAGEGLAGELHLSQADMRDFDLGREFDLIFAAIGTLQHLLSVDGQRRCLACVRRHLAPGGLFVAAVRPVTYLDWEASPGMVIHRWTRRHPETGRLVTKWVAATMVPAEQVRHMTHWYDVMQEDGSVRRRVVEFDGHYFGRYELEGLLKDAGMELANCYGDHDLMPYNDQSEWLIVVAQPKEAP